jgi:hypothetical protein
MEPWVAQVLASIVGGGLAGGFLTIAYNWWTAQQKARAQEKATVASLVGELGHIRRLCDYNASLQASSIAPFVRFPTTVVLNATFEERHLYPRLSPLQQDLESLVLGVIQVNQWIDLRQSLLLIPYVPGGKSGPGEADNLRNHFCELCAGKSKLEGVGSDNFIYVPAFTDALHRKIKELM